MAAPKNELIQYEHQNPDAKNPLFLPMLVVCNTSDEALEANIRHNSETYNNWLSMHKPQEGAAIFIGGGASVVDDIDEIKELQSKGGTVFAMNGASKWARENGIKVDYQVIADAKAETSTLVDPNASAHLFASQCDISTTNAVDDFTLWHLEIGDIERFFPADRLKNGGYALIGGGASVGNSALCVAYTLGFRDMHIFGYDSSHKDGKSHAYSQPMNDKIPVVDMIWAGRKFKVSVAMKAQAEKFQITSQALKHEGCEITVYGDGLLQTMYHSHHSDLTEREKYQSMWQFDAYRGTSPGEFVVDRFLELAKPDGMIIDFGCGTGRGALRMANLGHELLLVDFTDNSRDDEALGLHFLQWDLSLPCPARAPYGFCTDVMEHIPPADVDAVIANVMEASEKVFFQISTIEDTMGGMIGQQLHLTVESHSWWKDKFTTLGYNVEWSEEQDIAALFYITRKD